MRLLIDTHALLWYLSGSPLLSPDARSAIEDPGNERFVSDATAWEIAIKLALGKLKLDAPYDAIFPAALDEIGLVRLALEYEHFAAILQLPWHHRDPFDRLLVAQAKVERLTLVSRDDAFAHYGIPTLW